MLPIALFLCCGSALQSRELPTLSAGRIAAARGYSLQQTEKALLVEQHGKVIHETYAAGVTAKDELKIYSGTKLFWCLAALAAVNEGLLKLDAPAAQWLPAWREDAARGAVTLRQLLDFSSGLEPGFSLHQDGLANRDGMALKKPLVGTTGRSFIYGPSGLQVFHAGLAEALKPKSETPTHYLEQQVLKPLRLGPQRYVADASGKPLLAAGFMLTAREWLRMGQLILHQGRGVVPESLFAETLRGSRANAAFSLGLWNNRAANDTQAREVNVEAMLHKKWQEQTWSRACLCKSAPADLVACIGSHGVRLYVVPSQGLVIVRLANTDGYFSDAEFLRRLFAGS